jgi:glycosyltransferase involved in cell wall biosynthesis
MPDVTIAIPTRDRFTALKSCVESILSSLRNSLHVPILVLHDCPIQNMALEWSERVNSLESVVFEYKQSLSSLWNKAILSCKSSWVLLCNDDLIFNRGWYEYLSEVIESWKYRQIIMASYSCFCIHKSLIPLLGWFDERFKSGYYEDVDWQIRLGESGMEPFVDYSHNSIFIDHLKYVPNNAPAWDWHQNVQWFCKKWGRQNFSDWSLPSFREEPEIDWHPEFTSRYALEFGTTNRINEINNDVGCKKPVFPTKDRLL